MVTKLSKVLVVFVTFASVAFAAVSLALTRSGPNWATESQALVDYDFSQSTGENPTWTVKHRSGEQALKTTKVYPDAIAAAYDDAKKRVDEEVAKVTPKIQPLKDEIAAKQKMIDEDLKGLETRQEQLKKQLDDTHKQIVAIAQETNRANEDTLKIRSEGERRRSDVYRLYRNYQALEADQFKLLEEKRRLLDLLFQMQGLRDQLKARADSLIEQGAKES